MRQLKAGLRRDDGRRGQGACGGAGEDVATLHPDLPVTWRSLRGLSLRGERQQVACQQRNLTGPAAAAAELRASAPRLPGDKAAPRIGAAAKAA
jgi:hypothetical protein